MLISMLQSIYHPDIPLPPPEQDEAVLAEAELFGLHAQLYHLLIASGRYAQLSPSLQQSLKKRYTRILGHSLFFKHKEDGLMKLLERSQLEAIILKGARFAERYFGHYTARLSSDIDLLVPESRFQMTIDALKANGYEHEITKDHHARLVKHGVLVELHWTLDMPDWSDLKMAPIWQASEAIAPYRFVKELSPLHTLYFICLHGARHQMISLRYLLDIVQILHACGDQIQLEELMAQAREDRTSRRVKAVLSIVYRQFPHLHDTKPLPFPMMKTPWRYDLIRDAHRGEKTGGYYRYKLFFRHFLFDSVKHQIQSIRKPY